MKKLVFSIHLILATAISYCQELTYIVVDYDGNLDKRVYTLNIHPDGVTSDEIPIYCGRDYDIVISHAVSQKHYDILTRYICDYLVADSQSYFNQGELMRNYSFSVYIVRGGKVSCELLLVNKQSEKYFSHLVDILNREKMNTNLSHYINKEILQKN